MKSAYELAMDRLEKQSPSSKLTDAQKLQIAEIESLARAKIAEKELFLREQMTKALANGDPHGAQQMEQQLAREIRGINSDMEERKAAIRNKS